MNVFELNQNQELRFQVGDIPVTLELRRGLAEVYGSEMLPNKSYTFPKNSKAAVFSYQGATIEVTGQPMKCHVGQRCDYMTCYLNIHGELEKMRNEAERLSEQYEFDLEDSDISNQDPLKIPDLTKTPICLVCKPMYARNVGKSTLCRILLNYATRRDRAPIFVDLDPELGHIGLPGSIGALSIESPIDIEEGMNLTSSMLLHFGHTSATDDSQTNCHLLYQALVQNMANIVHSKLRKNKKTYYSGVIINTNAWTDDTGYKLLLHACRAFKANIVLVMDDEVLQDDLKKDLADCAHQVDVLNMPKTVGIVSRMPESNAELKFTKIREYFYGTKNEMSPIRSDIKFSFLKRLIYRIGNQLMLPDSLMPLGSKPQDSQVVKVSHYECKPSDLLHRLLAVSFCRIDDVLENPERILETNIMGFICVTNIDNDIVSILTPQKLPNPMDFVLLYSNIQYMDSLV